VAYRDVAGQEPRSEQRNNGCCLVTSGKHINSIRAIATKPPIRTIEELLETVFSLRPMQSGYEDNWGDPISWGLVVQLWTEELAAELRLWKKYCMCAVVTVRFINPLPGYG
jgi:hypothetical protein